MVQCHKQAQLNVCILGKITDTYGNSTNGQWHHKEGLSKVTAQTMYIGCIKHPESFKKLCLKIFYFKPGIMQL